MLIEDNDIRPIAATEETASRREAGLQYSKQ
jgi:hypothetical protein